MAYEVGIASGHYDLLAKLRTFLATVGYVEKEVDMVSSDKLIIWEALGLDSSKHIFFGIKTYQNTSLDYYNFEVFFLTGYVPGSIYTSQPGFTSRAVPLWQNAIPYRVIANGQRFHVSTTIQVTDMDFGAGFYLPFATPTQYPYPIYVIGMLPSASATRYDTISSSLHSGTFGLKWLSSTAFIKNIVIRDLNGTALTPEIFPYNNLNNISAVIYSIRPTSSSFANDTGSYSLEPLLLTNIIPEGTINALSYSDPKPIANLFGYLDGLYAISGFNNASGNITTINGVSYYVFRNGNFQNFESYAAMRLS